jgi:hypothetical protein
MSQPLSPLFTVAKVGEWNLGVTLVSYQDRPQGDLIEHKGNLNETSTVYLGVYIPRIHCIPDTWRRGDKM